MISGRTCFTRAMLVLGAFCMGLGCDAPVQDPPGDGFLALLVDKQATRPGYSELRFTLASVAVFYVGDDLPRDRRANYYVLRLPSGVDLEGALRFFFDRDGVYVTLPDTLVTPSLLPCDPDFENPGPFTDVFAPDAWDVTVGDRSVNGPVLAVVDGGFDLAITDLVPDFYINQAERAARWV